LKKERGIQTKTSFIEEEVYYKITRDALEK
jgi:hypothetical protein